MDYPYDSLENDQQIIQEQLNTSSYNTQPTLTQSFNQKLQDMLNDKNTYHEKTKKKSEGFTDKPLHMGKNSHSQCKKCSCHLNKLEKLEKLEKSDDDLINISKQTLVFIIIILFVICVSQYYSKELMMTHMTQLFNNMNSIKYTPTLHHNALGSVANPSSNPTL